MQKLNYAKKDLPGTELGHIFVNGGLRSYRDNGQTFVKTPFTPKWRFFRQKKPDVGVTEWWERKQAFIAQVVAKDPWRANVRSIPTLQRLERWAGDSVCETVSGEIVEPDGIGTDGAPSWLMAMGMI